VVPLAVENHPSQGIYLPDGRQLGDAMLILSEEDHDRIRQGYVCIKCLEPFEQAWPEHCPVCGCPVRSGQAAFFAQEALTRPIHLGPTTTLEEERAGIEERRRKEEERNARTS
jgi:hypothetical protein